MAFRNDVTAGTTLIREAIQSQNYVPGSAGWIIEQGGSAEFNDVTIRGGVTESGVALYYNGTPALGNLVLSIAAASGVDQFGNAYPAGLTLYDPTGTINLDGTTTTWNASPSGSGIQIGVGGGSVLEQFSPQVISGVTWADGAVGATLASRLGTNTPEVFLVSPNNAANPGVNASIGLYGAPQTSNGDVLSEMIVDAARLWANVTTGWISGAWAKLSEQWQAPSLGSGWVSGPSGGTVQAGQFRRDAMDNLVLDGAIHTNTTTPAAIIFTLPTGYRPNKTRRFAAVSNSGGTPTLRYIEVNSSGAVTCNPNIATASTDLYLDGITCPLGNIP